MLDKLRSTKDGDGTLLDHTLMLYGSGMSNSNVHNHSPLPILLAGGAAGRLKGGRHLKYPAETPMANLLLSILHKAGVEQPSHRRQHRPAFGGIGVKSHRSAGRIRPIASRRAAYRSRPSAGSKCRGASRLAGGALARRQARRLERHAARRNHGARMGGALERSGRGEGAARLRRGSRSGQPLWRDSALGSGGRGQCRHDRSLAERGRGCQAP